MRLTRRQCCSFFGAALACSAADELAGEWRRIAATTDGMVGAAALHMRSGRLTSSNGDHRFPLASVCKIPIAMNLLAQVDEGRRALDEEIEVLPGDVVRSVSPLAERWPAEKRFRLREMVELMVAKSDNTAVETLYRVGGEGPALAARFRRWQVAGVRIDRSERQCAIDRHQSMRRFLNDPRDTGTPNGTARLLARLFRGETLSKPSTGLLIDALKATTTFPGRLKGLLPPGTTVAHKTGTTETVSGLTAATNDSGVIFLPDGGLLAVSVYIKASTRDAGARDRVIARIARAAFDHYGG